MSYQKQTDEITQRIFQTASDLLQQVGDSFTMDQLAEQARVPRATVYRRVGSKVDLLQRLAQERGIAFTPQRDVRTRILQAGRQVLGRYGLVNTTIEQIANEADVGVATIYRHFGDKEHLVWAMIDELSLRPVVRDLVQPTADVTADLLTLTRMLLPSFYEYRDILRFVLTGNETERAYIEQLRTGSMHTLDQLTTYFATQIKAKRIAANASAAELALAYLGQLFAFAVIGPLNYAVPLTDPDRISLLIVQLFVPGLTGGDHERTSEQPVEPT
ncbi:MAG: TetR/AcrR family transcriptional regulator [Caldilineaceae bacterium]